MTTGTALTCPEISAGSFLHVVLFYGTGSAVQDTGHDRTGQGGAVQDRAEQVTYYILPLPTTYQLLPATYDLLPISYYLLPSTYYLHLRPTTYYFLLSKQTEKTIKNYFKTITETNDKHQETTINTNTKVNTKIQQEAHGLCYVMLKSWYGLLCQVMVFCVSI